MRIDTLTIVGVGLIGGSIGLAAKQRGLAKTVRGIGRQRESLDRARALGIVDESSIQLEDAAPADLIVFCTPVDRIAEQVRTVALRCSSGTILTDAGSTKGQLLADIGDALPPGVAFVGSHPLAGSEKRGPDHADPHLFQNRWTILTPTPATDPAALDSVRSFWQALGARVQCLTPEAHDSALALTSHLPHLIAAVLAGILPTELGELAATGFRDSTRIAGGDPALWTAIFEQNRPALIAALARFENQLQRFRQALDPADPSILHELLMQGKKVRDALGS